MPLKSRYIVTYTSQEDKSFIGWCTSQEDEFNDDNDYSGPLIVEDEVQPYNLKLDVSDYKVSDDKIIMYEDNGELVIIYDIRKLLLIYL
uniref:Uncharacterized protein n=1 Tax=Rhizophagus irregularis (strain DAOM 181602 / DAOM 197198 / MUCL 43194) TaxID=747089 RepID=U9U0C5_RHIID